MLRILLTLLMFCSEYRRNDAGSAVQDMLLRRTARYTPQAWRPSLSVRQTLCLCASLFSTHAIQPNWLRQRQRLMSSSAADAASTSPSGVPSQSCFRGRPLSTSSRFVQDHFDPALRLCCCKGSRLKFMHWRCIVGQVLAPPSCGCIGRLPQLGCTTGGIGCQGQAATRNRASAGGRLGMSPSQ